MSLYYQRDGITVYCGDCIDVMREFEDESIPLIITSPPYNIGAKKNENWGKWNSAKIKGGYDKHSDNMKLEDYILWQKRVLLEMWRVLSPDGAIFYNHKPKVKGRRVFLPTELNPGLPLVQIVIWARSGGFNYLPYAYVPTHEWVMIFAKKDFKLKSLGASGAGDVWRIDQARGNPHPAPFPLELPTRIIETTGKTLVLDPFVGSGTTLLAASNLGIMAIGIDNSEKYCEMAKQRVFGKGDDEG